MTKRRVSGWLLIALSLIPWLNLAVWTAYALAVRFAPPYMVESVPAPVDTIFGPFLGGSIWLLLLSMPVCLGWMFWLVTERNNGQAWRTITVYLLGWATTIFLLCVGDPVGFVNLAYRLD